MKKTMPKIGDNRYKHSVIPPEVIELNTPYTLTINPAPRMYEKSKNIGLKLKKVIEHIQIQLMPIDQPFMLLPELSCMGKLHFHGTIHFKTYLQIGLFYNSLYENLDNYTIEIDTITDHDTWKTYISKGQQYMKAVCKLHNIHYVIKPTGTIRTKTLK